MSPQTVNAYYNPTTNEICFPAGILQFPFYSPDAGIAWNYGAIGAVIAHEMTHGFDDQGRLFDKNGNMENWWTKEDSDKFKEITDKFVSYWNNVEVLPGVKANGELSLGENLADHGGVRIALEALKRILTSKEDIREFFLAYSANWAGSIKEEEAKRRVIEDVHSLGRNRVNDCLCHFDEWYEAFDVNEKDKMFIPKENRLSIW
jgi:putative endopeptidase